ncbi:hypothetical protein [Halotia branconii]|uniref:Uncharacterized protein n=1 Tax=Halotia branconii CENA392 TaxID=1539056 RepID=A0AAJ6NYW5_9CYAN|nr:hypothetical protein [Halotia branconii]WGV29197.1 hypothetical protein QI031_30820 [Halotia branconii CENA392]
MFETHTTKDGQSMLICQMEDRHLSNTIKSFCREIEKCRKILTQPTAENQLIAVFNPTYSQANLKSQAEKQLKNYHQKLQPYLAEAFLRRLNLVNEVRIAYGRTERVFNSFNIILELPVDNDDDYEDEIDGESDDSHPGHSFHYSDS